MKYEKNLYTGNKKGLKFIKVYSRAKKYSDFHGFKAILALPIIHYYRYYYGHLLGMDIPLNTKIGDNFVVWHCFSIAIHPSTQIGDNVTMRHCTTIGSSHPGGKAPIIGNNVDIGCNSVILGEIKIGNNVTIGAGSVVLHDVPDNAVVAGNPAKVIRITHNKI